MLNPLTSCMSWIWFAVLQLGRYLNQMVHSWMTKTPHFHLITTPKRRSRKMCGRCTSLRMEGKYKCLVQYPCCYLIVSLDVLLVYVIACFSVAFGINSTSGTGWRGKIARGEQRKFYKWGGYSHRCCTDSCDRGQNVVKRSSNIEGCGQTVKQPFSPAAPLLWMVKIMSMSWLRMRITLGSKGQGHKSGVVNRSRLIFGRSKILTPVAAIRTAPIYVTPPLVLHCEGGAMVY